jgi:Beta protein
MNFGPRHYVPVLKVKRGEKRALRETRPISASRVIPLLEIVERNEDKSPTVTAHLATAFKDLAPSVQSFSRCFVDTREIAPDGPSAAASAFDLAVAEGINFTPVTGISRSVDVEAVLSHRSRGIALRLTRSEFEAGSLGARLGAFVAHHGLPKEDTDLILDLGAIEDLIAEGAISLTAAFLQEVPAQLEWRTLTVSACAFPRSMGGVERHSHVLADREEWLAWRDGLWSRQADIQRLPTFSDCAIQHPSGVEGFDPRTMQVAAAIRYALPDSWLLIKGESTRRTSPAEQFPSLATKLAYGHLHSYFAGQEHCAGCSSMKNAANGQRGFGSAEAWRRLGTTHHIQRVLDDLAELP